MKRIAGQTDDSPLSCSRIDRHASALVNALDGRSKDYRLADLISAMFQTLFRQ